MDICERCHQRTLPELCEDRLFPPGIRVAPVRKCISCGHIHVEPNAGMLTEEGRKLLLIEQK
jgi:hypothetical protein